MKPKAVIFDMDGLMLDSERIVMIAYTQAAKEFNYTIPDTVYFQVIGRTEVDSRQIFMDAFGKDFPFDEIDQRRHEVEGEYISKNGIPLKIGLLNILDCLESKNIPKIVATSTITAKAKKRLEMVGIGHRFVDIVGGDQVKNGKPSPDLFLLAASRLQVDPSACLVFEDSPAGIRAAKAAGINSILVPDLKEPPEEVRALALHHCKSLVEAVGVVEEMFAG